MFREMSVAESLDAMRRLANAVVAEAQDLGIDEAAIGVIVFGTKHSLPHFISNCYSIDVVEPLRILADHLEENGPDEIGVDPNTPVTEK